MTRRFVGLSGISSAAVSCALIASMVGVASVPLGAQSRSAAQRQTADYGRVENTQVVVNGGVVTISYDLISSGTVAATFDVGLEASRDGGRTYDLRPETVRGDVGAGVAPGTGKAVVWEAAKDTDNLQLGQLRFRVVLKSQTPRVAERGVTQRDALSAESQFGAGETRKGRLWTGIGMIGLGGFWVVRANVDQYYTQDEKLMYSMFALGLAGTGALLVAKSKGRASRLPSIAPMRKGFAVYKTVQFR